MYFDHELIGVTVGRGLCLYRAQCLRVKTKSLGRKFPCQIGRGNGWWGEGEGEGSDFDRFAPIMIPRHYCRTYQNEIRRPFMPRPQKVTIKHHYNIRALYLCDRARLQRNEYFLLVK